MLRPFTCIFINTEVAVSLRRELSIVLQKRLDFGKICMPEERQEEASLCSEKDIPRF